MQVDDLSNIGIALNYAKDKFSNNLIKDPEISAELLLADVCCLNRQQLYSHYNDKLSTKKQEQLISYIKRRLNNEPLQYIMGYCYFRGLKIFVNEFVLIPRPETELLLEYTLDRCSNKTFNILDLCSGSACIACCLASELNDVHVVAIDNSQDALEIAQKNVIYHKLKDKIDLVKADIKNNLNFGKKYDLIISNPPYVASDIYYNLDKEVRFFEPKSALVAKDEGLEFYPHILSIAKENLSNNGFLALEICEDKSEMLKEMCLSYGFSDVAVCKDLAGKDRILFAFAIR